MTSQKTIYCCGCEADVTARLSNGKEAYPHRSDLYSLPFWFCDGCGNFVGCHHKTSNPTRPLGVIPTKEIKRARQLLHRVIDPIWKSGATSRKKVYAEMTKALGYEYHTAEVRSVADALKAVDAAEKLADRLGEVAHD